MEPIPALLTVGASYAAYLLGWRRIRVVQGRRRGPDLGALAVYDHRALALELGGVLDADDTSATGGRIVPVPAATAVGPLPDRWASSPWTFAKPSRLAEAREALLLGLPEEALARSGGAPAAAVRSLFAWATFFRLFSGEFDRAAAAADSLVNIDGELASRLLALVESRRAESTPDPDAREVVAGRALTQLRTAGRDPAAPAFSGLGAHLEVLRLGFWNLEAGELLVRRRLHKALERHPQAPMLHLIRAHLAAALGDGIAAADHLARALYYANGDPFYARPIAASPFVARVRPALAAQARAALAQNTAAQLSAD